jgi:uncharacterized protein (DUF2267 family)
MKFMFTNTLLCLARNLAGENPADIAPQLIMVLREVDTDLRPQDGTDVMERVKRALDRRVVNGWGHWDTEEVQ